MKNPLLLLLYPVLVILCGIPITLLIWHANVTLDGSIAQLYEDAIPFLVGFPFFGSVEAWKIILFFILTAYLAIKILPGRKFSKDPMAPDGTTLIRKANGITTLLCLIGLFGLGSSLSLFRATIIYDHFSELLGVLNIFCFIFYLGSRLNTFLPQWIKWNMNVYTICRLSMIGWALIILSFATKQHQLHGLSDSMIVTVILQLFYIAKFFWWEMGYLRSMDVSYDRAGFIICWGSIVWLPAIYTSPTLYLVHHPVHLGLPLSLAILTAGACCIIINFLIDRQRLYVRSKNGECLIWKKKPDLIFANYRTEWGEERQNLLLVSGWWGISRHFHYIPELLGAFFWSVTAGFTHFLPYFYLAFLALLLIDRAWRQEQRCARKYGEDWEKYCEKVPFRIIPFIY